MTKEELETNPFDSLHKTLVFSPRDWGFTSEDVWIYGIIVGWGDDCCKEFEKTFSWWTKKDTKRLKYMHSQFVKIAQENGSKFCTFDELEHLGNLEKQLTKAKELLKKVIKFTWGEGWNYSLSVKVEVEQFLKEVEDESANRNSKRV